MSKVALGLYVHLPWCTKKCPYCDFNSYALDTALAEARYVDALLRDFSMECEDLGAVEFDSIFFGGGTPSLFSAVAIRRLLEGIRQISAIKPDAEITLEANPGSAEVQRFAGFREAGVNRLSLGVQSFDDAALRALGRVHSASEAIEAIRAINDAGFDNFNLDLMFGLPEARPGAALDDLKRAIDAEPKHISWYQLTLEAGTAFARKPPRLPSHDEICDDYDGGLELLSGAGYEQYEISAHARAGWRSRHNLNYWHFGDYVGIGAGAHGKVYRMGERIRRCKIRQPERYMKALENGRETATEHVIAEQDLVTEFMLNALRLRAGFSWDHFTASTGLCRDDRRIQTPLSQALARGWLNQTAERVYPTEKGFRYLSDLQLLFFPD